MDEMTVHTCTQNIFELFNLKIENNFFGFERNFVVENDWLAF